jgi:hypothetical protein
MKIHIKLVKLILFDIRCERITPLRKIFGAKRE